MISAGNVCAAALSIAFLLPGAVRAAPAATQLNAPTTQPSPVVVTKPETLVPGTGVKGSLLLREIGRQSLVIAAQRAGVPMLDLAVTPHARPLSAATMPATAPASRTLNVTSRAIEGSPYECIVKVDGDRLDNLSVPFTDDSATITVPYATFVTELAPRIDQAYVPLLRQRFGGREPLPFDAEGALPPEVEALLARPDMVSAFHAARLTLDAIDRDGESPARLGALARAYANLGESTRCLFGGAFDVFFARALLDAERLVIARPDDAQSYWTRAYVRALVGMYPDATADIAHANDLAGAQPDWAELIEPLINEDQFALDRLGADLPAVAPMAAHFAMRAVEFDGIEGVVLPAAGIAIRRDPADLRAMCVAFGLDLDTSRQLAQQIPAAMSEAFADALQWRDLPSPLHDALAAAASAEVNPTATRRRLWQSFDRLGLDGSELPWATLAELSREVALISAYHELRFDHDLWGMEAGDDLARWWPLIQDSPWGLILATYAHDVPVERLEALPTEDEHTNAYALVQRLGRTAKAHRHPSGDDRMNRIFWQADRTAYDWAQLLKAAPAGTKSDWLINFAHQVQARSPGSTLALTTLIRNDWGSLREKLPDLEQQAMNRPAIACALCDVLIANGDIASAQRIAVNMLRIMPFRELYISLANAYLLQGDTDEAVATYREALQRTPDLGLNHSSINADIAWTLMKAGRPAEADPYAREAAASGSYAGIDAEAEVDARLGRLAQADAARRGLIDRYGDAYAYNAFVEGLIFDRPAGDGLDARFRQESAKWATSDVAEDHRRLSCIAMFDGDWATVEREARYELVHQKELTGGYTMLAVLHLRQDRKDEAVSTLGQLVASTVRTANAKEHERVAQVALDILAGKPAPTRDGNRDLVELTRGPTIYAKAADAMLLGEASEHAGHRENAIGWFQLSAQSAADEPERIYSIRRLRGWGVDPFTLEASPTTATTEPAR